jgi:hypothetical protein
VPERSCDNFPYGFEAAPKGRSRRRLGGQAVAPAPAGPNHAGRPVASLRELSGAGILRILSKLGEQPPADGTTGSAWDQRDEDTWIDRLQ